MDHKSLSRVEVKDADRGEFAAVFSTLNVIDSDGDVTVKGAFDDGASVRVSAYNHASWQAALPVGKARIRETRNEAVAEGNFFLETTSGRDTFEVVKAMGELGEWSYGFDVVDSAPDERDGRKVRLLKRLKVHEVSPVLLGAGVGTRTLSVKNAAQLAAAAEKIAEVAKAAAGEFTKAIRPHDSRTTVESWDGTAVIAAIAHDASVSELRSVFAWFDGDPEMKASYRFPHHHGPGGPANLRACIAGIATLNGAKGAVVPDEDRAGVYAHLAGHMRDADMDPPELRADAGTELKLSDELAAALAEVDAVIASAYRVDALRAAKGKSLSQINGDLVSWLADDLHRLQALINNPAELAQREFLRFVQWNQGEQP